MSGHIVVCGLDTLGLRLVKELRRLGEDVVVVVEEAEARRVAEATSVGASIVRGGYVDEATLHRADVQTARALALVEQNDVGNLHAGLTAQEINPQLRIVVRLFNDPLREAAESLLHDSIALSASAMAAPLFVSAALDEDEAQCIKICGRRLVVAEVGQGRALTGIVLPLAGSGAGDELALLPEAADLGGLALYDAGLSDQSLEGSTRRPRRLRAEAIDAVRTVGAAAGAVADRRFRWLLVAILLVTAISVLVFSLAGHMAPLDALYFTVTTITTTGYGDITARGRGLGVEIYVILLIVVGATLLALFYALLIDAIVGVRLTRALGGVRWRTRDHVVVCGLGNVGLKIVAQLIRHNVPVVAIEQDESSLKIATARRLGAPVIVGDASLEESLRAAHVEDARCLIAATNDDVANLEAALNARHVRPDLRIVLRLFDHDLAQRIDRTFGLPISRSVSALAAPAFAAALLDRQVLSVIPVGHHVLVVAELAVEPGSALVGAPLAGVDQPGRFRVVSLRSHQGETVWKPEAGTLLAAGDTLIVVSRRTELSALVGMARSRCAGQAGGPGARGSD